MSDTALAPEQAQAAPEAPATAPAAAEQAPSDESQTPSFEDTLAARTNARISGDTKEAQRLDAVLKGLKEQPVKAADEEPPKELEKPEAPKAIAKSDEEPAPGEGEDSAGTQPEKPEKDDVRVRYNHLPAAEKDQARRIHAATVAGMSLKEATDYVLGKQTQAEPEPAKAPAQAAPEIGELESAVQTLETQLDDAILIEDRTEEAKIIKELSRANARLESAKVAKAQSASQDERDSAAFDAQRREFSKAAVAKYPEMANKQSPQWLLARDMALAAQHPTHPDHEKSWDADAPEFFAAKAAKMLGIDQTGAKATTTAPAQAVQQQPPATRPASGAKGTATPPAQKTGAQLAADSFAHVQAVLEGRAVPVRRRDSGAVFIR